MMDSVTTPKNIPLNVTPDQLEALISATHVAAIHHEDLDLPSDMAWEDFENLIDMLEAKAGEYDDYDVEPPESYLNGGDDEQR